MEEPATAIAPGTVIAGTYRIERVLGEGGMGLVFEALHLRVARRVAIKVLRTAPDAEEMARFRQEAEIASRIGHPNIIEVFDFNTTPSGTAYLVMELLEGESLSARARRGPMPHTEALPILRQIASGLFAAHGAGVIHRDLKPANVFLIPRELDGVVTDHVKILDFGISKVQGSLAVRTQDDVVLGTPRYMAPEQALGRRDEIDARADQFALAVIAFELLAGRAPFEGGNGTQVMFNIVYQEPSALRPLAPDVPPNVVAAIERALSKRPQDRFEDMSELAHALTGKPFANAPERPHEPSPEVVTLGSPRRARSTGAPAPGSDGPPTANDSPRARAAATPAGSTSRSDDPATEHAPLARRSAPPQDAAPRQRSDDPPTANDSPRSRSDEPPTANDSPRARASAPPTFGSATRRIDDPPTANDSHRARPSAPPPLGSATSIAGDPPTASDSPRARASASPQNAMPARHIDEPDAGDSPRKRRAVTLIAASLVAAATTIVLVVVLARRAEPARPDRATPMAIEPTGSDSAPAITAAAGTGSTAAIVDAGMAAVDATTEPTTDDGVGNTGSTVVLTATTDAGSVHVGSAPGPTDAGNAGIDTAARGPTDAAVTPSVRAEPRSAEITPEALALLEEAEGFLRAGKLADARFAAQRALRIAQLPRAHLVLAEAACRGQDLGAAHAAMRALSRSGRATARARCAAVGFQVDDP